MKHIVVGLVLVLVALVAIGCGGTESGDASFVNDAADAIGNTADDVAAVDLPEYLTEEEVSAAFEDRSERKDDTTGDIYSDTTDVDCTVTDAAAGEARCTEEVEFGSYDYPRLNRVRSYFWRVTYNPETGVFWTIK